MSTALIGTAPLGTPATMRRRVLARVIDVSVAVVLVVALNGAALAALLNGGGGELALLALAVLALWSAFSFWAMFVRAALPGQLMLGLHHVDSDTGRRAGGRTILKYLVQACTFGFALLITPLSIQAPNRSWFDRVAGVTLVDAKAADAAPPAEQVAAPPTGWQADESQLTQMGVGLEGPSSDAMIQSVPFDSAGAQVTRNAPPAVRREPGVVEPRTAAPSIAVPPPAVSSAAPPVTAPAAPGRGPLPVAVLDTGETFDLSGPLILGRAPRQSASLGQAELVVVADPSVSANHLALGVEAGAPWVMDLSSTNGSWVEQDGRGPVRLEAMSRLPLSPGATVRMGRRTITVTAR